MAHCPEPESSSIAPCRLSPSSARHHVARSQVVPTPSPQEAVAPGPREREQRCRRSIRAQTWQDSKPHGKSRTIPVLGPPWTRAIRVRVSWAVAAGVRASLGACCAVHGGLRYHRREPRVFRVLRELPVHKPPPIGSLVNWCCKAENLLSRKLGRTTDSYLPQAPTSTLNHSHQLHGTAQTRMEE